MIIDLWPDKHAGNTPEVKTIRRKLAELAAEGKAAELQLAIARQHAARYRGGIRQKGAAG